ncbi:MAG: putative lipopolysaccharide heptosyltransferase III [Betaproteobacteria bacterium]|nr:putative lipopolysaccharide heptosyltransferase III [Betaproteobacteria bacterium]
MTGESRWLPRPDDAPSLQDVRRALVVKLRHLGDVLLTSPVFSCLKSHAPHIEVDALVYRDTAEMLDGHPDIAQLFTIDRKWKHLGLFRQIGAEGSLISALKARRHDLIINLTEHNRGVWLSHLLRPKFSVAPAGEFGWLYDRSFTHRYPVVGGNRRHTAEIHLDSLRRLGVYPGPAERRLTLVPGAEAREKVSRRLAEHGLAERSFMVVHPGSRWHFKCWTVAHMQELIRGLQAQGWRVVLSAAPDRAELALVDDILDGLTDVVNFAGSLSLKELAALIGCARLFIGVDSAPMHIAAAMGTPTVALFGPSGDIEWGPWQVPSRIITADYPCRPCGLDGCGGGKRSECLEAIGSNQVLGAVKSLLQETD